MSLFVLLVLFILVSLISYLVGWGIKHPASDIDILMFVMPTKEKVGKGEKYVAEDENIEENLTKFRELRGPDITANENAIKEFGNQLRSNVEDSNMDGDSKNKYYKKINDAEAELLKSCCP
jgi:hypothetical protein